MRGRALTDEQKLEILATLKEAWLSDRGKAQRLGQLIDNATDYINDALDVFYIEDEDLQRGLILSMEKDDGKET